MHYILDSSVMVKWFNHDKEDNVEQALRIMDLYGESMIELTIPDLSIYEIANALRYNKNFLPEDVKKVVSTLLDLRFNIIEVKQDLLNTAVDIAYENSITVYDAIFISISDFLMIPLVTANPKHKKSLNRGNIIMLNDIKL